MHAFHLATGTPRRDMRFGLLLLLSMALFIALIAGPEAHRAYLAISLPLGAAVIIFAVRAAGVGHGARVASAGACVGAAAVGIGLIGFNAGGATVVAFVELLVVGLVAPVLVVVGLVRRATADVQLIYGSISIYMLVGVAFTMVYAILAAFESAPIFTGNVADGSFRDQLYFSFITLTTVGYGDIAPLSGAARATAVLEAIFGQLYLVVIVATAVTLVTAQVTEKRRSR